MKRRAFLGATLAAAVPALGAPAAREHDFDVLWRAIDDGYAYFDTARRRAWRALREPLRREALRARGDAALMGVLEAAIARLRDDSVTLAHPHLASRRVPYDLDIWPGWRDRAAIVEAVRAFSDADLAGAHPGQRIVAIDGVPAERAIRERLRGAPGDAAEAQWALRRVLVEARGGGQRLEVREGDSASILDIERAAGARNNATPPVLGRRMGEQRDIGYIRARMGPDERIAAQFDAALGSMSGTRALIVDLRDGSGPAPRPITLSILSPFARDRATWQLREAPGAARIADAATPAGPPAYSAPVAVLVDRWTAGEAEALAAGLAAIAGARIVGTPSAGLHGEPREIVLPASGILLRYPAERTFLADGTPREALAPHVAVDPAAPSGGPGDPILYQALKLFERR